jgi:hypothetical protein
VVLRFAGGIAPYSGIIPGPRISALRVLCSPLTPGAFEERLGNLNHTGISARNRERDRCGHRRL